MMGEVDAEAAFATVSFAIIEAGLIYFAQFFADIQTQAGAKFLCGVKRLKYLRQLLAIDAGAEVYHL